MNGSSPMHNLSRDVMSSTGVLSRDGHIPDEDTPAEAYVSPNFWKTPTREAVVKNQRVEAYQVPSDGSQCLPKYFADMMLAAGCIRVEIWHMRFRGMSGVRVDKFPTEVVCAPSLTFDGPWGEVKVKIDRPLGGSGYRRPFAKRSDTPTERPQTRYGLRHATKVSYKC
jgi:hypothetical protein